MKEVSQKVLLPVVLSILVGLVVLATGVRLLGVPAVALVAGAAAVLFVARRLVTAVARSDALDDQRAPKSTGDQKSPTRRRRD